MDATKSALSFPQEPEWDESVGHRYESVFVVCLILLAFLFRDNPYLVFPQIYYLLVLLLGLNLAAGAALRSKRFGKNLSAAAIMANCGTIAAILSNSGEQASNLWVLFLLPIYTACILLDGREVVWITVGAVLCNAAYYFSAESAWNDVVCFEISIKSALLAFGAAATWRVVTQERRSRRMLGESGRELKRTESYLRLFRRLVGQIDDAILIINPDTGHLVDVNGSWSRALGYERDLFKMLNLGDIPGALPDGMRWRDFVDMVRSNKALRYRCSPQKFDRLRIAMEIHAQWTSQDGKDYIVAVAREIVTPNARDPSVARRDG
jgi:PAS domain-containing protein